ncbi:general secretion pathway protein GspB [Acidovorax sp. NB1]|uniref:general secretion pathway protein GspB n=1 Tax=Acidovorax sp. NB1 TaxID=1943571 RepID=UPI0010DA5022|nr:general secretion pathway protein GspB [Acidovorax sp. NB1]GDY38105.1 hypothetical protein ACINB_39970 [Acidovorax sp. NB1]
MSYILDALRRAEAERGRGGVPGLHSQAVPVPGAAPVAERPAASPWLMASTGVAVAAVAVAGTWWVMQRPAPAPAVVVAAAPAPTPAPVPALAAPAAPVPAPAPAAVPAPAPALVAPAPEPRAAEKRSAAPSPREKAAPPAPAPRGTEPSARSRSEPSRDPARDLARDAAPARLPEPAAAAPAPATATGTVFAQGDLPEAVRAQLPSLKISGVTYSGNPAYRMAIVNGQVLHEGDPAGPGLLLEKIEPGRTIWSFKGYRYGLASQ